MEKEKEEETKEEEEEREEIISTDSGETEMRIAPGGEEGSSQRRSFEKRS